MRPQRARIAVGCALVLGLACGPVGGSDGASSGATDGSTGTSGSASATGSTSSSGATSGGSSASAGGTTSGGPGSGDAGSTSCTGFMCDVDLPGTDETCDPGKQDCSDPDDKCTGYVTMPGECCIDANHCVPVSGDKQLGEPCTRVEGDDDCAKGLFCMTKTSGAVGEGVCLQYCDLYDPTTCGADPCGGKCMAFNDGALPLCEAPCDVLAQDCPGSQICVLSVDEKGTCMLPNGNEGAEGDPCYTLGSCQAGLTCIDAAYLVGCNDTACCTPMCDLNDGTTNNPACTEPGYECQPVAAPDGCAANVGACALP